MVSNLINSINKRDLKNKRKGIIIGILVLVIVGGIILKTKSNTSNKNVMSSVANQEDSTENKSLAEVDLNVGYSFVAKDAQGNSAKEVNFVITKAEKNKEVLIQGKPANAKGDKAFLVLHIEIDNPETKKLYLTPVDLLRLIGEDEKKFAPDIHSEVVEIQPISTKITRVGFVILADQQSFLLQIGELNGDKQNLEINFP